MKLNLRYLKIGICIFIFLFLLGVSNRLLLPVYNRVGHQIQRTMELVQSGIKSRTGLVISYKSLSPSILFGININGIVATDAQSGEEVVRVGRLSLGYALKALAAKDFKAGVKNLVLRDVEIRIVKGVNDWWLSGLMKNDGDAGGQKAQASLDSNFLKDFLESLNFEGVDIDIGSEVKIYRLRFVYKSADVSLTADLTKAFLSGGGLQKIDALVAGSINASVWGQKISGDINFSSAIPRAIDGSSAVLRFSNLVVGDYRARYLGFLAEYRKKQFAFKMLPSARNIYAEASANLESGDIAASVFADGFNLSNLAQTSRSDKLAQSLFALNFSIKAEANYNYKSGVFGYSSSGDVFVPGSVIPAKNYQSDTIVSYSIAGDEKKIDIPYLRTSGERYNISFEGSYEFASIRPSGTLGVESFVFPSGGELSTEIFIDPQPQGFMCFAPQIFLGQKVFTAAQLTVLPSEDSWDWTFEVSDYSRESEPGSVSVFGSYSPQTKASQASLSFNAIYLDSIVQTYAFFAQENIRPLLNAASETVQPFVFSCDTFASGIGMEFSFSVPYAIVANTSRDDQMLILEADGNKETFQLSRLEFVFGGQKILMDAMVEKFPESSERLLSGRLELNEIPYNFSGVSSKGRLEINSEYGLRFAFATDASGEVASITGAFAAAGFPLKFGQKTFEISTESTFAYSIDKGFSATVPYFNGRLLEGTSSLNPEIAFSANIDSSGAFFDSISYSDSVSTLSGGGAFATRFDEEGLFDSADYSFALENQFGIERLSLDGTFKNTEKTPINIGSLLSGSFAKNLFFTSRLKIDSLRSGRFFAGSGEGDSVNATVTMQGQVKNPFVTIDIPRAVLTAREKPLTLLAPKPLSKTKSF